MFESKSAWDLTLGVWELAPGLAHAKLGRSTSQSNQAMDPQTSGIADSRRRTAGFRVVGLAPLAVKASCTGQSESMEWALRWPKFEVFRMQKAMKASKVCEELQLSTFA